MTLLFQELIIKTTTLANASVALQEFTAIVTFSDKNSTDNQQDNPGRLKSDGRCFNFLSTFLFIVDVVSCCYLRVFAWFMSHNCFSHVAPPIVVVGDLANFKKIPPLCQHSFPHKRTSHGSDHQSVFDFIIIRPITKKDNMRN